jgi:predicted transcriptional regulator
LKASVFDQTVCGFCCLICDSDHFFLQLAELGLGNENAVSIDWSKSVMEAITLMVDNKISSLALIEEGELVGTLSMSDVKYLAKRSKFVHLRETCADFIASVRQYQSLELHHGKVIPSLCSVVSDNLHAGCVPFLQRSS